MAEHFSVRFGDPSCSGCLDIVWKNRPTDRQTLLKILSREYRRLG